MTYLAHGFFHPAHQLPRQNRGVCGQCRRCHPGRQFGGDSFCTAIKAGRSCDCHGGQR